MDNLEIYNKVKNVPPEAKKSIAAGRLKGMTDINPMWRIKTMTEVFGVAGVGWYSEITNTQIDEGSSGEKMISVFVNVYVKQGNEWSKPVPGVGGAMLIAKESAGLRLDDEAYKKAYTDALSVAFKAFGVGASVYFEKDPDGKYETEYAEPTPTIKRAYDNSEVKEKPKTENNASTPQKIVEDFIKTNKTVLNWSSYVAPLLKNKYEKNLHAELADDEARELLEILKNKIKEDNL
jgi:hypothetical protein